MREGLAQAVQKIAPERVRVVWLFKRRRRDQKDQSSRRLYCCEGKGSIVVVSVRIWSPGLPKIPSPSLNLVIFCKLAFEPRAAFPA